MHVCIYTQTQKLIKLPAFLYRYLSHVLHCVCKFGTFAMSPRKNPLDLPCMTVTHVPLSLGLVAHLRGFVGFCELSLNELACVSFSLLILIHMYFIVFVGLGHSPGRREALARSV